MLNLTPAEVVAILWSARTRVPDSRREAVLEATKGQWLVIARKVFPNLDEQAEKALQKALVDAVLKEFKRQWLAIARQKFPNLGEQAEDAVQDAYVEVIQKVDQLHDEKRVEGWARAIFVNKVLDALRHERRINRGRVYLGEERGDLEQRLGEMQVETTSSGPTPEEEDSAKERLRIVLALIEKLTAQRQKLFELKFLHGQPDEEVAEHLGLSNTRVRHMATEIRQLLREVVGDSK